MRSDSTAGFSWDKRTTAFGRVYVAAPFTPALFRCSKLKNPVRGSLVFKKRIKRVKHSRLILGALRRQTKKLTIDEKELSGGFLLPGASEPRLIGATRQGFTIVCSGRLRSHRKTSTVVVVTWCGALKWAVNPCLPLHPRRSCFAPLRDTRQSIAPRLLVCAVGPCVPGGGAGYCHPGPKGLLRRLSLTPLKIIYLNGTICQ